MRISNPKFLLFLVTFWGILIAFAPDTLTNLIDYTVFSLLGVLGAIFANSTGAGGGVVFIPMFNKLGFTESQAIATSFAIQCFGMTAGALTWFYHYKLEREPSGLWPSFFPVIKVSAIASIIGLWAVYGLDLAPPSSLHYSFSWFSLLLGIGIIFIALVLKPQPLHQTVQPIDWLMICVISLFGGAVTAWLSVGIGELLAIYLIIRRFDVNMAVAVAVIVSALTVWSAIWQHTLVDFNVYWQVVLFAGPGAIFGGVLAKAIVAKLSAKRLKIFFAFWLMVIGAVGVSGG
ncbi:sulfite exporter TauE/SafE family protein [Thalassotalea sp. LPB0316]|nr:sulfite exporter TauE/SafE family protein [Thalassotalea sp. LPB0316]